MLGFRGLLKDRTEVLWTCRCRPRDEEGILLKLMVDLCDRVHVER